MEYLDPEILTPGIRKTVLWLREKGFKTTDSGDGVTNVEAGMGGALDIPHVHMKPYKANPFFDAVQLHTVLRQAGIDVKPGMIQLTYDPVDDSLVLSLYGVLDKDLHVTRELCAETMEILGIA